MDTDGIRNALTRKLGPLPAWAWAVIAGIGIYVYRNRSGKLNQPTPLQPSQDNALPPQDQVTLQPGESVYDPNSGVLTTAPGSDTTDTSGLAAAYNTLAAAIAKATATSAKGGTAPDRGTVGGVPPRSTPKGKGKHPNNNKKPHNTHNMPERGTKRTPKPKGNRRAPKGDAKRPRSNTRIRERLGRPNRAYGGTTHGAAPLTPRAAASPTAQATVRARQRPTQPMVSPPAQGQHQVSSHQPKRKEVVANPPRPSSPPRRTVNRTGRTR